VCEIFSRQIERFFGVGISTKISEHPGSFFSGHIKDIYADFPGGGALLSPLSSLQLLECLPLRCHFLVSFQTTDVRGNIKIKAKREVTQEEI
jgi:hypothetical protein